MLIPYSFFPTMGFSNNTKEYKAVIPRLELALQIPITSLTIYGKSELLVRKTIRRIYYEEGEANSLQEKGGTTTCTF